MGIAEVIGFTILTVGSAITGIIYALKHVKTCKLCGCGCVQETVASTNDTDDHQSRFPSPLSATKMFMKKKKDQGGAPHSDANVRPSPYLLHVSMECG